MAFTLEELLHAGEKTLIEAKANGLGESLTLDFKADNSQSEARMFAKGKLTPKGRAVIGTALSAFSNSAGGLLVLGVDCRMIDGIDRIQELQPLDDIEIAFNSVQSAIGELLQPRHDTIRVFVFESELGSGKGYITIDVPRSERRPHRCEAKDAKQYYKRSGTSSFAMEHYDIEDAFHRRSSPALRLQYDWQPRNTTPASKSYNLILAVQNEGQVGAKNIGIVFSHREGIQIRLKAVTGGESSTFQVQTVMAPPTLVCHPGAQRAVIALADVEFHRHDAEIYAGGSAGQRPGQFVGSLPIDEAFLSLSYEIVADDMRPVKGTIELTPEELRKRASWERGG